MPYLSLFFSGGRLSIAGWLNACETLGFDLLPLQMRVAVARHDRGILLAFVRVVLALRDTIFLRLKDWLLYKILMMVTTRKKMF